MRGDVRRSEAYDRRSWDRRYSGLRCEGGWVGGNREIGAGECIICPIGAAGVTAAVAAALLALLAIRSSRWHRRLWRRNDGASRTRGGISNGTIGSKGLIGFWDAGVDPRSQSFVLLLNAL